jgi:DNA-binding transcriptional MerR regulator
VAFSGPAGGVAFRANGRELGSKPVWHNFSSAGNMSRAHPDENSRPQQFGSADVCRIARVSARQLQWWDEQNIVSPVQRGHRRLYLPEDVIGVIVIAGLRRKGLTLQRIRPLLRLVRREIQRHLEELLNGGCRLYLLTDGRTSHFEDQPARIIELLKSFRTPAVLVSLGDAAECVTGFQKRASGRASDGRVRPQLKLF